MEKSDIESGHVDRGDNGSSDMDDSSRRLLDSIRAMVETLRPPLSSNCCIYRVPKKIRELNEAAYTPHLVSIGPFHNGKVGLQNMEKHKVRYLDKILQLPGVRLKKLVIFIKECEERVRSCYAETIDLEYDKFLNMVLLDGCFIIKLFLMNYNDYFEDEEDKILRKFLFRDDIVGDLFLLENQLPFFLLEGLYNIAFSTALNPPISFLELSCKFFKDYNQQEIPIQGEEVKHFTDLLRTFLLPSSEKKRSPLKHIETSQFSKSATDLKEAGVKFKVGSSKCLIDVQFSDGELEIPFLKFEDITESYFRNIMALEQCHHYSEIVSVSSYIFLMDSLIDTSKDVDLLVRADIIKNWLGHNNHVATLVNKLSKEIVTPSSFYYTKLCEDLNKFCKEPWHSWMATCRHDYFSTPWRIASTIAAFVLLLLTFIQTVASIISLFV